MFEPACRDLERGGLTAATSWGTLKNLPGRAVHTRTRPGLLPSPAAAAAMLSNAAQAAM